MYTQLYQLTDQVEDLGQVKQSQCIKTWIVEQIKYQH